MKLRIEGKKVVYLSLNSSHTPNVVEQMTKKQHDSFI